MIISVVSNVASFYASNAQRAARLIIGNHIFNDEETADTASDHVDPGETLDRFLSYYRSRKTGLPARIRGRGNQAMLYSLANGGRRLLAVGDLRL